MKEIIMQLSENLYMQMGALIIVYLILFGICYFLSSLFFRPFLLIFKHFNLPAWIWWGILSLCTVTTVGFVMWAIHYVRFSMMLMSVAVIVQQVCRIIYVRTDIKNIFYRRKLNRGG